MGTSDRRYEVLLPVKDPALKVRLAEILDVSLNDDTLAWELQPDGEWKRAHGDREIDAHHELQRLAMLRTQPSPSG